MSTDPQQEHIDAITALIEADSGRVEVAGDAIIVTLPETVVRVTYRKPAGEPRLIASDIVRDPNMTLAQQTEFLANAWRLANDQARALGWIA